MSEDVSEDTSSLLEDEDETGGIFFTKSYIQWYQKGSFSQSVTQKGGMIFQLRDDSQLGCFFEVPDTHAYPRKV